MFYFVCFYWLPDSVMVNVTEMPLSALFHPPFTFWSIRMPLSNIFKHFNTYEPHHTFIILFILFNFIWFSIFFHICFQHTHYWMFIVESSDILGIVQHECLLAAYEWVCRRVVIEWDNLSTQGLEFLLALFSEEKCFSHCLLGLSLETINLSK